MAHRPPMENARTGGNLAEAGAAPPYLEQHVPWVGDRLRRAGIRLAHLLNGALGQQELPCATRGGDASRAEVESVKVVRARPARAHVPSGCVAGRLASAPTRSSSA